MPCKAYLFDENIDKVISKVLTDLKLCNVHSVRDYTSLHKYVDKHPVSASDYKLLAFCLQRNWSLCSHDHSMLQHEQNQLALPSNRAPLVILPDKLKNLNVREKAIWILEVLPKLQKETQSNDGNSVIFFNIDGSCQCLTISEAIDRVNAMKRTGRTNFKDELKKKKLEALLKDS